MTSKINEIIRQTVQEMDGSKSFSIRKTTSMRWANGNKETCKALFIEAFKQTDKTFKDFKYLPEYDKIVDWMFDTQGRGLCLTGDVGRGKSTILLNVLPVLFKLKNKILHPVTADMLPENYKTLLKRKFVGIDEFGVEPVTNDYGQKFEAFNTVINDAEMKLKPLFLTTNLSSSEINDRYGERTIDRIDRLCKIVKFQGQSLRSKNL
ncbi:MAG: hypothetical protein K9J21_06810 [Bacteroidales bacterium]|nr:hypothetical protein [Bacteroidales bacterium]